MRRLTRLLAVCILVALSAQAQSPAPQLVSKLRQGESPIRIADVEIRAMVHGGVAETTIVMKFQNPNRRRMEGMLTLPLPDGAVICGYGLDINGKMVEGVVVKKDKARQAFESETRRRVDPGLVEAVKGNSFKTRVYPIPAKGHRTVSVTYLSELAQDTTGNLFVLPMKFQKKLNRFRLRVKIVNPEKTPKVIKGRLANFDFKSWNGMVVADEEYRDIALTEDLLISLPVVASKRVVVEACKHGTYFLADAGVDFPRLNATRAIWTNVTLFWDASASHRTADHEREYEMIRKIFAAYKSTTVVVNLIEFRNVPEPVEVYQIHNGNCDGLIKRLKSVIYDGGTQIGALALQALNQSACLMFSDGISNFGKSDPTVQINCPVYSFGVQSTADHNFLRYMAVKTGGRYFNLKTQTTDTIVKQLAASDAPRFVRATLNGKPLADAYPSQPTLLDGRFLFCGKLPQSVKEGILQLDFAAGQTKRTVRLTVNSADTFKSDLIRKMYGRMMINELSVFKKKNQQALVDAGRTYGMVTLGTSLIVMESLEQYLRHRIVPPKSLAKIRSAYFDRIEAMAKDASRVKQKQMSAVVGMWQEVCSWHKRDFKYDLAELKRRKAVKKKADRGVRRSVADEAWGDDDDDDDFGGDADSAPRERALANGFVSGGAAKAKRATAQRVSSIKVKKWSPDTPYIKVLQKTGDKAYKNYLDMRKDYGTAPSYYLDCADHFIDSKQPALGLRILSNIAEVDLENPALLRVLGHRLAQLGELRLAAFAFEEVLVLRPEEPQSLRDLALVLADLKDYNRAVELLYRMALTRWDRFAEMEKIALVEMNRVIAKAKREGVKLTVDVDTRLIKLIDTDIRIVMTWDADQTDMDLWVKEPSGESCSYNHNRTAIGGRMSRDFTNGYGPEEYMVKNAANGGYTISSKFFGSRAQMLIGAVTLQATVYTNYGRSNETRQTLTFRLKDKKERVTIGTVRFGKANAAITTEGRHYQIKSGDTLYSIARDELNDSSRWKDILKANPGLQADKLTVGQILKLP